MTKSAIFGGRPKTHALKVLSLGKLFPLFSFFLAMRGSELGGQTSTGAFFAYVCDVKWGYLRGYLRGYTGLTIRGSKFIIISLQLS